MPVSKGGFTYLFTPRETLRLLFQGLDLSFPPTLERPLNFSSIVEIGDTLPVGLNHTTTAMGGEPKL